MARGFEESGLPTVTLSSALDITRRVLPPRSVFLNYPLGHTAGPPGQPELQRQILTAALAGAQGMHTPGSLLWLPHEWPNADDRRWRLES